MNLARSTSFVLRNYDQCVNATNFEWILTEFEKRLSRFQSFLSVFLVDWKTAVSDRFIAPELNLIFSFLTMLWIVAGGVAQYINVFYLHLKRDRLEFLTKPVKILLLAATPFLLGPAVLHLYGVIFMVQNSNNANAEVFATAERYNTLGEKTT